MKITNLSQLFVHQLQDLYDAEYQLVETLPRMVEAAVSPELKSAFQNHLEETQGHVTRLEVIFEALEEEPDRNSCKAMKGLIAEAKRIIKDAGSEVIDAGLISAARRVEHYEIAAYETLLGWARTGRWNNVQGHLQATLAEEKAANQRLTGLTVSGINSGAAVGDQEAEDQMERSAVNPY